MNNGEGYVAKLPARQILDPAKVAVAATPRLVVAVGQRLRLRAGKGHNLDIYLPGLTTLPAGTHGDAVLQVRCGTSSGTTTTASC